jgi:hypothetical protein
MIIKDIKLSITPESDNIYINMERSYPLNYNESDQYILERYELDLNDRNIRFELRNVLSSQTVLQYFSESMFMSSAFHMVPINSYSSSFERTFLDRAAIFEQAAEFIDITNQVTSQNSFIVDNLSRKSEHLYLYRIVYLYNEQVYHTNYHVGFESILSTYLGKDKTKYKKLLSEIYLNEVFGPVHWENLYKYFLTEEQDTRSRFRQDPIVFKVPYRKVNHRKNGPLEDYKIKLNYREADKNIKLIKYINNKVKNEFNISNNRFNTVNLNIKNLTNFNSNVFDEFLFFVQNILQDNLFGVLLKNGSIYRFLSKSALSVDSSLIPDMMTSEGIYILSFTNENIQTLYDQLSNINIYDTFKINDVVYIGALNTKQIYYEVIPVL